MNETKFEGHTPGPWCLIEPEGLQAAPLIRLGSDTIFFVNGEDIDRRNANAALIAAAPDLLAEVVRLRAAVAKHAPKPEGG